MNTHRPHVDDLIGAYVLDSVDIAERHAVERHLEECVACRAEVRDWSEATVRLSDGYEIAPPPALRSRILDAISAPLSATTDQASRVAPGASDGASGRDGDQAPAPHKLANKSIWGLAAAGLLAVGGWGVWQNVSDDLSPVDEVIQASDAETFTAQYDGETIEVVASSSLDRAVLRADGLPDVGEGQTYQAWWVGADATVTSAGVISSDSNASDLEVALEGDVEDGGAFALSVEPLGGSEQPTTDPVVVVPLS